MWSPFMVRESAYNVVTDRYRVIGTGEGGTGCDYQVYWVPFGRWVVNCEEGHFVTMFGMIF